MNDTEIYESFGKKLKEMNLNELYNTFSDEEKQAFWCGLLEEIKIDENKNIIGVSFSK